MIPDQLEICSSTNPVIRLGVGSVAVSPHIVVLVVRISSAAQVEPAVFVTGVIGNKIHDQLQSWSKQTDMSQSR